MIRRSPRRSPRQSRPEADAAAGWLPELCRLEPFLVILIGAEVVALVAVLAGAAPAAPTAGQGSWWSAVGAISLYVQWLALTCTVALCGARSWLNRLRPASGGLLAWLLCVSIALAAALVVAYLDRALGLGLTRSDMAPGPSFVQTSTLIVALVVAAALRYAFVHQQWQQQVQAHARAEADALQARIRPHFLFNSLNTIASLIPSQPQAAEDALLDLSDLFRASLRASEHSIRLAEERELCQRYLAIEQARLGDRLQVQWDLQLPDELALPPLSLQPLVENAVYHGIQNLPQGGCVRIEGRRDGARWLIEVSNPVPPEGTSHRGSGQALANVRARLQHRFGHRAGLECLLQEGYHRARLWLPLEGTVASGEAA